MANANAATFIGLFEQVQLQLIQTANSDKADASKKAYAESTKRMLGVMTRELDANGVDGLKTLLNDPQKLQRLSIDPQLAGSINGMVTRHEQNPMTQQEMGKAMGDTMRQAYRNHLNGQQQHAAPPAPPPQPQPQPQGAQGQQSQRNASPPPSPPPGGQQYTSSQQSGSVPPSSGAGAGSGGSGSVPPVQPTGTTAGGSNSKQPQAEPEVKIVKASKTRFGLTAAFAALAVGVVAAVGTSLYNKHEAQEKIDASPVKVRTPTIITQAEIEGNPKKVFVDMALGAGGLTYKMQKDSKVLTSMGLPGLQQGSLSIVMRNPEVKQELKEAYAKDGKAFAVFVANDKGQFEHVPMADADKYKDKLRVVVGLDDTKVSLTVDDPKNGKGPQSVNYPNEAFASTFAIKDPAARTKAQADYHKSAEERTAAAKAAAASAPK